VAAEGDVVVDRGTQLGFLFVRSGVLAGRDCWKIRRLFCKLDRFLAPSGGLTKFWSMRYSRWVVGATGIFGAIDRAAR